MNFFEIFTLLIFLIQNIFILFPVTIYSFKLDLLTAPPAAVILLLATTSIPPQVFVNGIVGDRFLKPFNIMILFISLAYLALSLNRTGLLKYLAFKIAKSSAGESSRLLLTKFYIFSLILSIIMGNDPIILAATGFLVYFSRKSKLDPIPFIFTEFSSSNIGSMVLFCGNPTNLIICEGFGIPFLEYSKQMILPFLSCAITCYLVSIYQFKDLLSRNIVTSTKSDPIIVENVGLNDIGSDSNLHQPISDHVRDNEVEITDDNHDHDLNKQISSNSGENQIEIIDSDQNDVDKVLTDPIAAVVGSIVFVTCIIAIVIASFFNVDIWIISLSFAAFKVLFDIFWDLRHSPAFDDTPLASKYPIFKTFYKTLPTLSTTLTSLPFDLVIFAFSQFILVEALTYHSWTTIFATGLSKLTINLPSTAVVIGILTLLLCATLGTNITATILLTRVIIAMDLGGSILSIAWISLALGSNIGAVNVTISASLAGLLWKDILKNVDFVVSRSVFWKWNWVPLLGMGFVGYLVVYLQVLLS